MDLYKGATHSTSVHHRLSRLYRIPKSSQGFESAFDRFYSSAGYEQTTDNLDGVELEEFISFLDEVRSPPRHQDHLPDRETRC